MTPGWNGLLNQAGDRNRSRHGFQLVSGRSVGTRPKTIPRGPFDDTASVFSPLPAVSRLVLIPHLGLAGPRSVGCLSDARSQGYQHSFQAISLPKDQPQNFALARARACHRSGNKARKPIGELAIGAPRHACLAANDWLVCRREPAAFRRDADGYRPPFPACVIRCCLGSKTELVVTTDQPPTEVGSPPKSSVIS